MRIVICGNYGSINIGDEAILTGILTSIGRIRPHAEITVLSADPSYTSQTYCAESRYLFPFGIRSFLRGLLRGEFFRTLRAVRECDYVIFGGGGLFSEEKHAVALWLSQVFWFYLLRKPVYWFAQGFTTKKRHTPLARMLSRALKKARLITVRDAHSYEIVKSLKGSEVNLHLTADPVFMLDGGKSARLPARAAHSPADTTYNPEDAQESRKLAVIFAPRDVSPKYQDNLNKNLAQLADFLDGKYGLEPSFISFQSGQEKDTRVSNTIIAHMAESPTSLHVFRSNASIVLSSFRDASFVVAVRLHAILFSILTHTPFMAISYSDKITKFLQEIGLESRMIPVAECDFDRARDLFSDLWLQREENDTSIAHAARELHARAMKNETLLREFLKDMSLDHSEDVRAGRRNNPMHLES